MQKVAITAGHGARDPGAVNTRMNVTEAGLVLALRDEVAALLRMQGLDVVEDGKDFQNLPLSEAVKLVPGRLAVELHFNAGPKGATGVEAISLPKMKPLAQGLAAEVSRVLGTKLRGDGGWIDQSRSQHPRLAFVQAGGVILAVGFISNDADLAFYLANSGRVARAIANVVYVYATRWQP